MNEKWLAVSVNNFRFAGGSFASPFIYAFDKAAMVDNARSCRPIQSKGFRPAVDPSGTIAFTVQPALHYTTNSLPGTPLFFVSTQPLTSSNTYVLWRLKGAAPELEKVTVLSDTNYTIPPNAPQLGGDDLDSGDMRVQQVAYRDGRIWAVHSTGCNLGPAPSESCIRAVEFQPTETGGQITFSETFGSNDWFNFWPGIAVNQGGDVVTTFQRSRANRFLDVAYNGMPAGTDGFDVIRTLKVGQCTLFNDPTDSGVNRTGDYVGVQTDPLDNHNFWISGEYTGQLPGLGCNWKTHIARVNYSAGAAKAEQTSSRAGAAVSEDDGPADVDAEVKTVPRFRFPDHMDLLRPHMRRYCPLPAMSDRHWGERAWPELRDQAPGPRVAILPLGAVEAHGPHLPLLTDGVISEAMAEAAAERLTATGIEALVLPRLDYTPAPFAAGFAGTISIRPQTLTSLLVDIGHSLSGSGVDLLAIANAHLDPANLGAISAAVERLAEADPEEAPTVVFPDLTRRRWADRLTAEFRTGACHAGRYESSVVLACRPDLVRQTIRRRLEPVTISLSRAIQAGQVTFEEAGGSRGLLRRPRSGDGG